MEKTSSEMGTPVKKQTTDTFSQFEDSPVYNFISNLSPLKTVKSLRISQRFNSLSFPSVASVFTSPQISSTKGSDVLKNHEVLYPSSIKSLSENEEKVYTFDEQKENHAANTYEYTTYAIESQQRGSDHMLCDGVQSKSLSEETNTSEVSLTQDFSMIESVSKIEEETEGDWERLISNTSDFLIFDSPDNTYDIKGKSLCKSPSSELACENTINLHNTHYVDPNGAQRCQIEPPVKLVDIEPLPNLHRGVRRRCLVYETGGARKKQLEETSSSDPIMFSPYNLDPVSIDKQLNNSACDSIPGVGLHLNAIAKTSNTNSIGLERQYLSDVSLNESHFSVGLGQYYLDQSSAVENELPGMENANHTSLYLTSEDINQTSPKKKRRKMEDGEGEGCKRCNCKKSKCLKLYCECFAAGVYCVEPCSCQECFNKPIHEETVLATRKQIESRNPLAFAPKVVRSSESAPETRHDSSRTPASARHKRGCNCKKSGCLKKYCECYQEGVGCSINCRCEGCKNVHGRKDGSMPEPEAQLEEVKIETQENSAASKSLHEYVTHNRFQQTGSNCISTKPLTLARASVHLPCSSRTSLAGGSSSKQIGYQNPENTNFLHPQPKFEKESKAVEGDEMPEILQGNYSSLGLIKSRSPNSKRVSPPHCDFKGSPSRMTSRKLILQSISSFPSLTPKE